MNRAERRHRTATFVAGQLSIARAKDGDPLLEREPGRLKKHHALDCGCPDCGVCGNPRHTGQKHPETVQELRALDRYAQGVAELSNPAEPPPIAAAETA